MAVRTANAEWKGSLQGGEGTMAMQSGAFEGRYSFSSRFEEGKGTNPEELIAAAHAGCFSMALSAQLGERGIKPESIRTTATVTLDKSEGGFAVTASHLDVKARIPGGDQAKFDEAAKAAKDGCPISKLLNATITMAAVLES